MLHRLDQRCLRDIERQGLAAALDAVGDELAAALHGWPRGEPACSGSGPIARLAAGPDGRLVQVAGRSIGRARPGGPPTAEGRLVYAVGDLHGCYDLLIGLLRRMAEDAAEAARGRRATVVFLGDYVDRGPDSARVLEALCRLKTSAPFDLCLLKGNHEEALLRFLDSPGDGAAWIAYGGAAALAAYGVHPPAPDDSRAAYELARDQLLARMPASHLRLLQTLDLMAVIGGYAFVHAGVAPGEPLRRQAERDLLWIRREFLEASGPFERVVVHGHTWADDRPTVTPVRIGLDTGAYETGVLSALRIEDEGLRLLQMRDPTRPPWRRPGEPPPWTPVAEPLDFTRRPSGLSLAPVVSGGLQPSVCSTRVTSGT